MNIVCLLSCFEHKVALIISELQHNNSTNHREENGKLTWRNTKKTLPFYNVITGNIHIAKYS